MINDLICLSPSSVLGSDGSSQIDMSIKINSSTYAWFSSVYVRINFLLVSYNCGTNNFHFDRHRNKDLWLDYRYTEKIW